MQYCPPPHTHTPPPRVSLVLLLEPYLELLLKDAAMFVLYCTVAILVASCTSMHCILMMLVI